MQSPPPSLGDAYGSISGLSLRLGSWLLFAASSALLVVVISTPRLHFDSVLRMALLGTLAGAIALQLRYFLRERGYHREAASAFQTADREFRSVFEHALDAIVIVNSEGICLNANPATFALLGLPRAPHSSGTRSGIATAIPSNLTEIGELSWTLSINVARRSLFGMTKLPSLCPIPPSQITCPAGMSLSFVTRPSESLPRLLFDAASCASSKWPIESRKYSG